MSNLQTQIQEKRRILRSEYGGLMTLEDLVKEIRVSRADAKAWGHEIGAAVKIRSTKYDVDVVAKHIVMQRGMC